MLAMYPMAWGSVKRLACAEICPGEVPTRTFAEPRLSLLGVKLWTRDLPATVEQSL